MRERTLRYLIVSALFISFLAFSACGGGGGGGASSGGGSGSIGSGGGSSGSGTGSTSPVVGYSYYVGIPGTRDVAALAIHADGSGGTSTTLSDVTGLYPSTPAMATTGGASYLFVPSGTSDNLTIFQATGSSLVQVGGALSLSYTPQNQAICVLSGPYLVLGDYQGNIHVYPVLAGGSLGTETTYAALASTYGITGIAASPDNKYLLAEGKQNGYGNVGFSEFRIGAGGALVMVGSTTLSSTYFNYSNLVADPSTTNGHYFYSGGTNGFYLISASASGPSVTVLFTPTDGGGEWDFVGWIDPTGTWVYVNAWNSHTSTYTFDQFSIGTTGLTTYVGTEPNCNPANNAADFQGTYNAAQGVVLFSAAGTTVCTYSSLGGVLTKPSSSAAPAPIGALGIMVAS
uniref:Uncharacterized protein n=1 Tax=Leptospirillum ferrodiazotrophum TaxID=412449 RepID=C6HTT8_9BACT|nr:MAG: conserved hypothetical protein [Leptospirillum ferrodiazotrophum]